MLAAASGAPQYSRSASFLGPEARGITNFESPDFTEVTNNHANNDLFSGSSEVFLTNPAVGQSQTNVVRLSRVSDNQFRGFQPITYDHQLVRGYSEDSDQFSNLFSESTSRFSQAYSSGDGFSGLNQGQFGGTGIRHDVSNRCGHGTILNLLGKCVPPKVSRKIFFYKSPSLPPVKVRTPDIPEPKITYNYVFVKTADSVLGPKPVVVPATQQKTLVVLLSEKQKQEQQQVIEVPSVHEEPEVFFVNYNDNENPVLPGGIDLRTALRNAEVAGFGNHDNIASQASSYERTQDTFGSSPHEEMSVFVENNAVEEPGISILTPDFFVLPSGNSEGASDSEGSYSQRESEVAFRPETNVEDDSDTNGSQGQQGANVSLRKSSTVESDFDSDVSQNQQDETETTKSSNGDTH